jgi:ribonuclease D
MEDTQLAAALVGFPLQLGYQRLVEEVCGIALAKEATRSDWLKRPLAPNQLAYAADDVRYLETVRHWLGDKLALLGRMTWWKEECQRLLTQVLKQTPPDDIWRQVKGAGNLAEQPLTRLKLLAAWRDQQARQRNLPRSFIIKDAELMALCQKSPASTTQLANLGLHPSLLRREGNILLDLLQQAKTLPPPEPLPGPLDSEQKQRCNKWRKMAQQIAADLGLEPEVLVRRRWLEALVRNPDEVPEPLTGWRYEVITRLLLTSAG